MIGFFIKKSFFDGWDHLFGLVLLNLGFIACLALGFVLPGSIQAPEWLSLSLTVVSLAAGSVWWSACVYALKDVSDFGSLHARDIWGFVKRGLVSGLQVGALLVVGFFVVSVGLPFYMKLGGIMGALAAGVIFWCAVIILLAVQYYIPLRARLGGGFKKNVRKSFIVFFDNPGFSIFLFLYSAVNLALSFFLAFLIPGFAGIALAENVALRLRLYKYDWIEEHPDAKRSEIPWETLLEEDRDLVGKRTLKGMFFPWKE
jgi:uncharacterized membrane protein YesL